jgi:Tfp pilus assembly protein PilF/predicted Zn-dependent protease
MRRFGFGIALITGLSALLSVSTQAQTALNATDGQNHTNASMGISPEIKEDQHVSPKVKELFSQAVHLLKVNRAYQARDLLEQAAALAPKSAGIHCNLGLAYQNSGNMPKALTEFKTALELAPHMPEATLNLAGCYQSIGANSEAIHWYSIYLTEKNVDEQQRKQINDIIVALKTANEKPDSNPKSEDYLASVTADGTYRWGKDKLPIRVFIQTGDERNGKNVSGFKQSFRDALLGSFADWCAASGSRIAYKIVPDKEHADIFCTWTSNPLDVAENGTLSERGSAKIIVKGSVIERATLKILTRPILEDGILSQDEMKKACLHEVGHVLGLQGHSTNNHDVMFFTVDTATVWPVLSRRDRSTIARLYEGYSATASPIPTHNQSLPVQKPLNEKNPLNAKTR